MPLHFHPRPGTVLVCDFDAARVRALPLEMTKRRPVVVVSRSRRHESGPLLVVPLSTTKPLRPTDVHVRLPAGSYPFLIGSADSWAKCDCVAAVSPARLDRLRRNGQYIAPFLDEEDVLAIRRAVVAAIGASHLLAKT